MATFSFTNSVFMPVYRRILDLILYRTYAELKSEAKRTYIGMMWWILEPIIFMLIFYFVFGVVFERGVENFVPFLMIGLTTWHWIQATIIQSSNAIVANQSLINQVVVPKALFSVVIICTNTVKFAVVYCILLLFLYLYGLTPSLFWFFSIPILGAFLVLISGLAILCSAIIPLIPDVRVLIDNGFRALFFLSGIFFDISSLPPEIASWFRLNPIAVLLQDLRNCLMYQQTPDFQALSVVSLIGIFASLAGFYMIRKNRSFYAKSAV